MMVWAPRFLKTEFFEDFHYLNLKFHMTMLKSEMLRFADIAMFGTAIKTGFGPTGIILGYNGDSSATGCC